MTGRQPDSDREPEEVLTGGNTTAVARVGETVRRVAGAWSPTIHALLRHLRANGVDWVPEPYGFADDGREILTHDLVPFLQNHKRVGIDFK